MLGLDNEVCGGCVYWWDGEERDGELGQCRRYPPKLTELRGGRPKGLWPRTSHEDFCGEFVPYPAETK